jgi:hypothetical protein
MRRDFVCACVRRTQSVFIFLAFALGGQQNETKKLKRKTTCFNEVGKCFAKYTQIFEIIALPVG